MSFTLIGAFGAGLLTFVSPCVLPMAPVLIASLLSVKEPGRFDRVRATLWFSLGFSVVFVVMGLGLPWITKGLGQWKPLFIGLSGVIMALFGARMMGLFGESRLAAALTRTVTFPEFASRLPKGLQGLGFGALFGLTWTPCVGPVLGGVLTYVASQELSSLDGAAMLGSFALGVSLPFITLAAASEKSSRALTRFKRHLPRIEYAAGLGLFVFGIYVVSQARLQDFHFRGSSASEVVAVDSTHQKVRLNGEQTESSRLVFFYSESCPVCHAMEAYLPDIEKECTSSRFLVTRINVDLPENQQAAAHFGVKAVPTVSVLNPLGDEVIHLVGYQTESRLRDAARQMGRVTCAENKMPSSDSGELPFDPSAAAACTVGTAC